MTAPVTRRELPPEEWDKLLAIEGPIRDQGHVPDPHMARFLVMEAEGQIIAYWGAFTMVHVEPLYIRPEYRQRVSVARQLWEGMKELLQQFRVPAVVAVIQDVDAPVNLPQATKIGFERVPGGLYYLDLEKG